MARDGKALEETWRLLDEADEADEAVTRTLLEAEATMQPPQQAQSHPWSPKLVTAQRKAALITKYCRATLNHKTSLQVFQLFGDQGWRIDTSWSLPEWTSAALEESKKAFKQQAIQAKKNVWKLRKKFLQQKVEEQVSCINEEDCDKYIQRIKKKEEIQIKHRIIKARLKEDQVTLTYAEMPDGAMMMSEEMTPSLVDWNRKHFQQPIRNGVTMANGGAFSKGLHPHKTSPAELQRNTHSILEDDLDKTAVQHHELPFYDALHSTTNEVLEKTQRNT